LYRHADVCGSIHETFARYIRHTYNAAYPLTGPNPARWERRFISMGSAKIAYSLILLGGLGATLAVPASAAPWQEAVQQQASRLVGAITAINGKSLTVQPSSGAPTTVTVSDTARILQTAPGAKTLAEATPIQLTDLSVGDRVLIAIHPGADGSPMATTVVAVKQAAIAQAQQAEQADWQHRGVGGLVKTVDASAGTVTIAAGARMLTIHVTPKTVIRRYDPESIKFSDAKPSTLAQIQPGDQLRARGDRNADGSEVTADEIVTGSFRNIAGLVVSSDPAAKTVTVNDLTTKKPVVIHISADSQLHKLPPEMAQSLAIRFKNGGGRPQGAGQGPQVGTPQGGPSPAGAPESGQAGGHPGGGGGRSGDLNQFLERTPVLQISELHKGDAVMVVATQGTPDAATAVTLLAGVEPILTASATQNMFSASWNLGGGGDSAGTQ
jgi:Domain of unknown function (DUF5666)